MHQRYINQGQFFQNLRVHFLVTLHDFMVAFGFLGKLNDQGLERIFGESVELTKSATKVLSGSNQKIECPHDLLSSVNAAYQVAGCNYEHGTSWGTKVRDYLHISSHVIIIRYFLKMRYDL